MTSISVSYAEEIETRDEDVEFEEVDVVATVGDGGVIDNLKSAAVYAAAEATIEGLSVGSQILADMASTAFQADDEQSEYVAVGAGDDENVTYFEENIEVGVATDDQEGGDRDENIGDDNDEDDDY
ncbi:hypothetical protein H0H92_008438 [Tricholoma furcatifolium]|nr:hypothetical protein H0H92_008438 [Tricholoma furcatifolium]